MNLSEIIADVYFTVGEAKDNSRFSETILKTLINRVYQTLSLSEHYRYSLKESVVTIPVTALSADATTGDLTITVDAITGFGKNRKILITDNSNFEYKTISSITGLTITLTDALENDYDTDSYVVLDEMFLPWDCGYIIGMTIWSDSNSKLTLYRDTILDRTYPKREGLGDYPTEVYFLGENSTSEGTFTAGVGTDTTKIVCTSLPSTESDYYNGWLINNTTRKLYSRVSDYNGTSKTLTMQKAITGQVSTDSFELIPKLKSFVVYVSPDASISIKIKYRAIPAELVNDYDIPQYIPEQFHNVLVFGTVTELFSRDPNNRDSLAFAQVFEQKYNMLLSKLSDSVQNEDEFLSWDNNGTVGGTTSWSLLE